MMSRKSILMIGMSVGSSVGSAVPLLWGAGWLSFASVLFGLLGGLAGIWLAFKMTA
jgi:hypothetical protein